MTGTTRICGTCRWWNTGFCASIEVMQHLESQSGKWRNFIERLSSSSPLLEKCWCRGEQVNTGRPGLAARHSATSSTVSDVGEKTGAFETIERSIKGD